MKYNIGDEVYWSDPDDDLCSGIFKVIDCLPEKVYLLSNGTSEVYVFEEELSYLTLKL